MNEQEFAYLKNAVPKHWLNKDEFILPIQRLVDYYLGRTKSERPMENMSTYLRTVADYCQFVDMEPEPLLREAFDDLNKGFEQRDPTLRYMTDYFKHVKKKRSENTAISRMAHLRTFYKANKFTHFTFIIPKMRKGKETLRMDKALALRCFENAESLRGKAIVHTLWATGLSVIDLVSLKRSELKEYNGWGYVELRRTKSKNDFIAIFPPDCMESINRYLDRRKDELDFIFVTETKNSDGEPSELTTFSVQAYFRRLAEDMDLYENEGGKRSPIHPHNFRKGHNTALKLAGLDTEFVEFLQGRDMGTRGAYAQYTPEQIVNHLQPYYDALRLKGTARNGRIDELEQRIQHLEETIKRIAKAPDPRSGQLIAKLRPKPEAWAKQNGKPKTKKRKRRK